MAETEQPPCIAHFLKVYELGRKIILADEFVPKTEMLRPAAKAFKRNSIRVSMLCTFPAYVADLINVFTQASDETLLELSGSIVPKKPVDQQAYETKSAEKFAESFNRRLRFGVLFRGTYKGDTTDSGVAAAHNLENTWNNVVNLASEPRALIREVFPNFFSSIFISAWTVFETLSHDLWISALNAHPAGLAELRGQWPDQIERDKEKREKESRRQKALVNTNPQLQPSESIASKALRLEVLQQHSYNVSDVMGDLLAEYFSFQRLDDIRDAYFKAFADQHGIWDIMLDKDIRAVCAIRNLLVHKAGLVDDDFKMQVAGIPRFDNVKKGESLSIDGIVVDEIVNPFFEKCTKLIKLVDEWIQAN